MREAAQAEFRLRALRAQRIALGGAARVSATATRAPRRVSHFAIDNPVTPKPSTSTFFPDKSKSAHRNFRVDSPNSTSIMVMIQNRTTT